MQIFLYGFLFLFFLTINFFIIKSDFSNKKIPNKWLLVLLVVGLSYNIGFICGSKEYIIIFYHFLYLSIAFLLYSFGIWAAGDAKYVFVLNLFLPETGLLTFIGNIGIITMLQLFIYALWFYIGKGFFTPGYWRNLTDEIWHERKEKLYYFWKSKNFQIHSLLFYVLLFLILFVAYRYFRVIFEQHIKNTLTSFDIFVPYFHIIFIIFFTFCVWTIKKISKILHPPSFIQNHKFFFELIFLTGIIVLLYHEYIKTPGEFQNQIIHILSLGLIFYVSFRGIWYLYKLSFIIHESKIIPIEQLEIGHIIDKHFIIKHLGYQDSLGFENEGKILSPNPKKIFQKMSQKIDGESKLLLQECYKILNSSLGKDEQLHTIKILQTFSFGIFIFIGFLVTKFYGNTIILYILEFLSNIIKSH